MRFIAVLAALALPSMAHAGFGFAYSHSGSHSSWSVTIGIGGYGSAIVPGYSRAYGPIIHARWPTPGNRFYATTINTTTGGGFFFVSEDAGVTWRASMRNMSGRVISYAVLQDEKNKDLIYLGTNNGIYRSLDRGASWNTCAGSSRA